MPKDFDYSTVQKYDLTLINCPKTNAVRLQTIPPKELMWGKYWYRSNIQPAMIDALKDIVGDVVSKIEINDDDIWLDIACNTGTLLSEVPNKCIKLGIDPADDTFYLEASRYGTIVQDYFSKDAYNRTGYGNRKCKIISCIAVLYDINDPYPFLKDIHDILDDNGLLVIQISYTPLMLIQKEVGNILGEHAYYYSLTTLKFVLEENGFKVVDAILNDVNGGSIRVFAQKIDASTDSFVSPPYHDVANYRIQSLLLLEQEHKPESKESWRVFDKTILNTRQHLINFIQDLRSKNKTIMGYGASSKGSTVLQYFGLNSNLLSAIADRSPYKWGLYPIGTDIPIISEGDMRKAKPDYLLVFPWHFINSFKKREKEYLDGGGKMIVLSPKFQIIGK